VVQRVKKDLLMMALLAAQKGWWCLLQYQERYELQPLKKQEKDRHY
jgi:hypothetical protein